jgi:predicted membrane protein
VNALTDVPRRSYFAVLSAASDPKNYREPCSDNSQSPYTIAGDSSVTLLSLILTIVVVGVLLWLINTYVPMQSTVKSILNIVVVIVLIVWLLSAFGLIGPLNRPIR